MIELAKYKTGQLSQMCIVVDKLQMDRGGAEKVLKELCFIFPNASVYTTTVSDFDKWTEELNGAKIIVPFWGWLFRNRVVWFAFYPLICFLYSWVKVPNNSMVLVYSSSAGKFINVSNAKAILYTNFPARGIIRPEIFFRNTMIRGILSPVIALFKHYESAQYKKFSAIYCISGNTKKVLAEEYGVCADVINCPISTHWFKDRSHQFESKLIKERFEYVLISRLTRWKRLEFVLNYFEGQTRRRLHVIGSGELLRFYKERYSRSCVFHGFLDESELRQRLPEFDALLFPSVQEWGLPLIEANACGLPIVAVESDAVIETQILVNSEFDSGTCVVYTDRSTQSIERALDLAEKVAWSRAVILRNADRFNPKLFGERMREIVDAAANSIEKYQA
jgi:glycosyltransferase involved in cell wall biosynthesis